MGPVEYPWGSMQVVSSTSLPCRSVIWHNTSQGWSLTVICKATFALAPNESRLAEHQEPILDHDSHWDDDPNRSVRAPSDLVPFKARADVLLIGSAHAPQQLPATTVVTRLLVGDLDKSVEIQQDRWIRLDGTLLDGARFTRMPLLYERAGGGPDTTNPVGVRAGAADGMGRVRLPNLVRIGTMIRNATEVVEPVGFGPLAMSWPARRDRLGPLAATFAPARWYDAALPDDLDPAFFNAAPRDQQLDYLPTNARIVLEHLHPATPRFVTSLPGVQPLALVEGRQGGPQTVHLNADTLWIDTERQICTLTYRARIPLRQRDEQGRVVMTLHTPAAPAAAGAPPAGAGAAAGLGGPGAPMNAEPSPAPDATDEDASTLADGPSGNKEPGRYAALPFRPGGGRDPGAPPDSTGLRSRNVGLPFMSAEGLPAEALAAPPPLEPSPAAPSSESGGRRQYQTLVFSQPPQGGALPFPIPAPGAQGAAPGFQQTPQGAPAGFPQQPQAAPPRSVHPGPNPSAAVQALSNPDLAAPARMSAPPPMPPAAIAPPLAPAAVPAPPMVPTPAQTPMPPPVAPAPVQASSVAPMGFASPESGPSRPGSAPSWGSTSSASWSPSVRPPDPAGVPSHDARAALGGLSAASDAASVPLEPATPSPASARSARPRLPPPTEYVDLLWYDDKTPPRVRQQAAWVEYLRPPARPTEWLTGEEPDPEPQVARDRRMIARALMRVPPLDAFGVARTLEESIDEDGILTRPLIVAGGELTMAFDPLESLKTTITVASQLAGADKRLKDAIDAAGEVVQARATGGPLVEGAATRIRQAFTQVNRTLPTDYLETTVIRTLIEERLYQRRTVLGDKRLCASLATGMGAPLPTYLPENLADKLPLFTKFRVRIIAEPHAQQDPTESEPLSLLVLALGRALPVPSGRSVRT
ncbi:DUF2169 family type VI secretion system accessory protein [Chondromyces crocatus]|uniref:DUF2169 domain-containing protein n=1 Tax=Chondromyces crocatus TaxID=52 RepID=A0A0K1EGZ1_CHOCO|nr:DUF2169 domain-containing protein [Chondromyces crocatus]AKT40125.1 uncharacterized protein CMC5_042780 [Chondromyces crocatus]